MKKLKRFLALGLCLGIGMSALNACGTDLGDISNNSSSLQKTSSIDSSDSISSFINSSSVIGNSGTTSSEDVSSSIAESSSALRDSSSSDMNSSSLGDSSSSPEDSSSSSFEDSSSNSGSEGNSSSEDSSSSSIPQQQYDTETRPLTIGVSSLTGNFNPFFVTAEADKKIVNQTQIGMLTTDELGNVVCGEEEPTVVLDYKTTMKDSLGNETTDGSSAAKTEYEFIIKNGIKFSDGVELTIKDVLFNLYVYLDPAYVGERTLYSTDIVGLQAYRLQDFEADDSMSESEFQQQFYAKADLRIDNAIEYLEGNTEVTVEIQKDIETIKRLFREEVERDWDATAGTLDAFAQEYNFTEDWEVYYFVEGIASIQYKQGRPIKIDGKYQTSLDVESSYREAIDAERNDPAKIAAAKEKYGCATDEEAKEYIVRDFAIDAVYNCYTVTNPGLAQILSYRATGANARDLFAAEARSEYFESRVENMEVESVRGITTYKTLSDFKGNVLNGEHDVLKVVINGVDPSAIYQFDFAVAPMHYYSNAETIASTPFGVKVGDINFFNNVLKSTEKNGKPVGAGVYKVSNADGAGTVTKDNFYRNSMVYFERNEYFDTVGGETITNAKIKYLRYQVIFPNNLINALQSGDIDFAEPATTVKSINAITQSADLGYSMYLANSYGYVGINPKYVPDIEVRRAIMKAMDAASIVDNYYTEALADVIYRPMSKASWAYPMDAGEYYSVDYIKQEISELVESAGWKKNAAGIYQKDGELLRLIFTIPGDTADHPAYDMLQDAAKFLNACGFDVTVTTDTAALNKLATGGLAVWAATTQAGIDPDLYARYHKDSKATSVKNWGYETIFADTTGRFEYEQATISYLSELIEEARETIVVSERKEIYAEALDLIMDLAVELPTYQAKELVVYNKKVIAEETLVQNPSVYMGVYDRIWEINYN